MQPIDPRLLLAAQHQIFDLDGTLINSFPAAAETFAAVTAPYGAPADIAKALVYANTHLRFKDLFAKLFQEIGTPMPDAICLAMYKEFEQRFNATDAEFFPGTVNALRRMRSSGKTLFLSSMSPDPLVERRLHQGNVEDDLFALRLGRTKFMKGPAHLQAFADRVGIDTARLAQTSVFWGDTAHDMAIARDAGIPAIGVVGTISEKELLGAGATIAVSSVAALITHFVAP